MPQILLSDLSKLRLGCDEARNRVSQLRDDVMQQLYDSGNVLCVKEVNKGDDTPVTLVQTDDTTVNDLGRLFLILSTKYFLAEPALQEIVKSLSTGLQQCTTQLENGLSSSNLSVESQEIVLDIFKKSFEPLVGCFDIENGSLRNTYRRNKFYRKHFNQVEPEEVPILDENGEETGSYTVYVPLFGTLTTMLIDDNVRRHCVEPKPPNVDGNSFDISDGNAVRRNESFKQKNTLEAAIFQDVFEV
ncbi:hypothetical protein QAD02_008071 [Eretmocerus hayati]|uniref:Uncharacterized protein n=1 Tax=Eretmocerus hayati TaxID=131215 RepID=A0ACC2N7W9_9HYME|nr:hypothetical protein QAD02_008071 [Eretmocerus hayati]